MGVYMHFIPMGVYMHFHDVFTPRDYVNQFLLDDRRYWTEQYMLEAFLSLNNCYRVVLALHYLHKRREPKLYAAFPLLADRPDRDPGSFWIERVA